MSKPLLTRANPKTRKGESLGYDTLVLHLAPANVAGCGNVCPHATRGCMAACLNTAGRGAFNNVQAARIRRTRELFPHGVDKGPSWYAIARLALEIDRATARARKNGRKLAVRLNGTSDLPWETYSPPSAPWQTLMASFPDVQFYDYTKDVSRMRRFLTDPSWPSNYHLTFSRSEFNAGDCQTIRERGGSIAVVATQDAPARWTSTNAVNGDAHDLTFLHPAGSILHLTPKGRAKRDETGFVLR